MNRELSAYLDLLRVFGALEVFASHLCIWNVSCGAAAPFAPFGGDGVVVFFVLSGYVIAYTADKKDRTARAYFINRCARIYSVALPAVVLTLALEAIGLRWFPTSYDNAIYRYQFAKIALYIPLWLFFSSEFWRLNEPVVTNGPFWSLCFEVWFYVFFAIALFIRGIPRLITIGAVALLVGPKICVFFPLWGLGLLAFQIQQDHVIGTWLGRALLLFGICAYPLVKALGIDEAATEGLNAALDNWPITNLQMAWHFPGYFLIALCVACSILGMRFARLPQVARIAYPVGILASLTFTIYLTHVPLLKMFVAVGGAAIHSMLWPMIATLTSVVLFGIVTERRIQSWRLAFGWLFQFGDKLIAQAALAIKGV